MWRITTLAAAAAALAAWCGSPALAGLNEPIEYVETPGEQEFSGEMIARPVQLLDWMGQGLGLEAAQQRWAAARQAVQGYEVTRYFPETDEYIIVVPDGSSENEVANALMGTGDFQYVEPNWIVFALNCPDDPLLNQQWHHNANRMNSCAGWELHTGNPSVTVAICDTGIQTDHPDLLLHRREGYNASTELWESQGGQIGPTGNHGTRVTGCSAANGDNGVGIAGVGWNLAHRQMRVSENGSSSTMAILLHAARTAVLDAGDRVANVSFSGVSNSSVRTTATVIKNAGGLLVWSAGNNSANLNWGDRDNDDVIVVGATNSSDQLASFSAYGRSVDLVAPGVSVFTTTTGGGYATASGTSFSAPLAAGLIALIWSADPSLTPDEVEQILKAGCDDLGAPGVDDVFGYGRINVLGSLSLVSTKIDFVYPDGLPDMIDPNGGTRVRVEVIANDAQPAAGTGMLSFDDGSGSGFTTIPMEEVSANVYDAVFPEVACGSQVRYFFSAETTDGDTVTDPRGAPDGFYEALGAVDVVIVFEDDFADNNQGWVAGAPDDDATTGHWEWGDPIGTSVGGQQAQPDSCHTGQFCWFTGQHTPGQGAGFNDVDHGKTTLFTPEFDLSGYSNARISYWRWYSNHAGANPHNDIFVVDISDDGGQTWVNAETVGPGGQQTMGGWFFHEFNVGDFVGLTDGVIVRFVASDYDPQALVEAALDMFTLSVVVCGDTCKPDWNGDGVVDSDDLFDFLSDWSAGDADYNGDGVTDSDDLFEFLTDWSVGC